MTVPDTDTVDDLVGGCDTVFHLAHDADSATANAAGARLIGGACRRAGVRRLVSARTCFLTGRPRNPGRAS